MRANDRPRSSSINQVAPISVSFAIPEARLPELKTLHGARRAARARRARPTTTARRRSGASRSSTTRSIRRPARSGSRARSPTPIAGSGRASSSTSSSTLTTDPKAIVVPSVGGAGRAAGPVRVRGEAGSDGRAAPGDRRSRRTATETVIAERAQAGRDRRHRRPSAARARAAASGQGQTEQPADPKVAP